MPFPRPSGPCPSTRPPRHVHGYTLLELLVVMTVIAILSSVAVFSFLGLKNSARDSAQTYLGLISQARTAAMSNTLATRLSYQNGVIRQETSRSCTDTSGWTVTDPALFTIPSDVTLSSAVLTTTGTTTTGTLACYSARGIGQGTTDVTLTDQKGHAYTIRNYTGGATRLTRNA